MKVEFRFNSNDKLVLTPENERERQFAQMAFSRKPVITLVPSGSDKDSYVLDLTVPFEMDRA